MGPVGRNPRAIFTLISAIHDHEVDVAPIPVLGRLDVGVVRHSEAASSLPWRGLLPSLQGPFYSGWGIHELVNQLCCCCIVIHGAHLHPGLWVRQ